jgi:hypothetical protein
MLEQQLILSYHNTSEYWYVHLMLVWISDAPNISLPTRHDVQHRPSGPSGMQYCCHYPEVDVPPVWLFTDAALKKHQSLTKAQSSLITQVRTGAIGLRAFLFKTRAPEALTPLWAYGEGPKTAKHLVIWCKNPPKDRP